MDPTKFTDPTVWSQVGGLNGLVIFALFASLGFFLSAMVKIYQMHREDLKTLLEMHAKERENWGKIIDLRQKETNTSMQAMAAALNEMNIRYRRFTDGSHHGD
jgi:hypothetical protein